MTKQATCAERVKDSWEDTRETLEALIKQYETDPEESHEDYGRLEEYGLAFDYVAPGTFKNQDEGYWRYQISYGGPSEEIRFYASGPQEPLYKAEYWFLDWFDGARIHVKSEDCVSWLWDWFQDSGCTDAAQRQARD